MRPVRIIVGSCLVIIALSACAKKNDLEYRGHIAEIDGKVQVVPPEKVESFCATNYCEPNYVYQANFGKKPTPIQDPGPAPVPTPTPPPVTQPPNQPVPNPVGGPTIPETLDYSRAIMGVEKAWLTSKGSSSVIVAVVDTGVQVNHSDLANNIYINQAEANGRPGVDDDGNGYVDDVYGWDFANNRANAIDDNEHGTHCAGIIGAEQNGIGVVGVSPKVKIMPLKFLDSQGSGTTESAVAAINYAVRMGAKVISNSWGGGGRSELLNQAIQNAINKGVIVVAAAGNEANNIDSKPSYPASYSGVISVASSDASDKLSSFSNYGQSVTIAAPGSNILSSVIGNSWAYLSGTSMATPQVSGAFALALAVKPNASAAQLRQAMCSSSKQILKDKVSCGRLDVNALIQNVLKL